jgi:hypothetical protein
MHPLVDQLEADLDGKAQVLRVSIMSPTGRNLANQHNVTDVPTFVVLDENSTQKWRGNSVPTVAQVLG